MKYRQEIKIGIVVTLIIFLFLWGYNFLKGRNLFSAYNYYHAVFGQVNGLQPSTAVSVNGYEVGLVSDISFCSDKMDSIAVTIAVKKKLFIPDSSIVELHGELLGSPSVQLKLVGSKRANDGDRLRSAVAGGMLDNVSDAMGKAKDVMDSLKQTLNAVNKTFDSTTQANIRSIVAGVERMVAVERVRIGHIMANFESVSGNLAQNNKEISEVISNLRAFSATLAASDVKTTVDKANSSLAQLNTLLEGVNQGEGTLGKLVKSDSLHATLQRSLDDLDKLLVDLRENPKDYVHFSLFGRKSKK